MRQFYTAAVQFKFNRRFRESGLLDGVEDLANETQIAGSNGLGRIYPPLQADVRLRALRIA